MWVYSNMLFDRCDTVDLGCLKIEKLVDEWTLSGA